MHGRDFVSFGSALEHIIASIQQGGWSLALVTVALKPHAHLRQFDTPQIKSQAQVPIAEDSPFLSSDPVRLHTVAVTSDVMHDQLSPVQEEPQA